MAHVHFEGKVGEGYRTAVTGLPSLGLSGALACFVILINRWPLVVAMETTESQKNKKKSHFALALFARRTTHAHSHFSP